MQSMGDSQCIIVAAGIPVTDNVQKLTSVRTECHDRLRCAPNEKIPRGCLELSSIEKLDAERGHNAHFFSTSPNTFRNDEERQHRRLPGMKYFDDLADSNAYDSMSRWTTPYEGPT